MLRGIKTFWEGWVRIDIEVMLAHPYLLDCKTACLEFRIGDPKETAAGADEHGRR